MQKTAIGSGLRMPEQPAGTSAGRLQLFRSDAAGIITKTLMVMRLTVFLLIISFFSAQATGLAQNVSISGKNLSLKQIFAAIEKQTGYVLFSKKEMLEETRPVSISVVNESVANVLDLVLKDQPFKYVIRGKNIILSRKPDAKENPSAALVTDLPADTIRVHVTDERGNALPGVTVSHKQKVIGFTNSDGNYVADVKIGDVLGFSFIGYATVAQKVLTPGRMTVMLKVSSSQLEEVAVVSTGYQNIPKERATGSFKSLSKDQIDKPATNIGQRLIGSTSGLVSTVDVNGNTTFAIRGRSSLSTDANPLIVLDGFPLENTTINDLNPNNIQSITVLKDAASASIWGSRAANGVIVITTKSGKKGVPFTAEVNAFTRIGSKFDLDYARNLASSAETVEYEKTSFNKWGSSYNAGTLDHINRTANLATSYLNEVRLGRMTQAEADAKLASLATSDNRNQIRDLIMDNPVSNQVSLNITGSTARMSNALATMFETNTSNFKGTDNKRASVSYRGDAELARWLSLDMNFTGLYQRDRNNGFTLQDIRNWSPYDMILHPDGSRVQNFNRGYYMPSLMSFVEEFGGKFPYDFFFNPLRELEARDFTTERINFRVQAGLTAKIIKGLTVSSRIMYDNNNSFTRNLSKEDAFTVRSAYNNAVTWNRTLAGAITPNLPKGAQLAQSRSKFRGYNFRNQIDFNRSFADDHAVNFVAGTEIRNFVSEGFTSPITYGYDDATLAVGNFPNGPGGSFKQLPSWIAGNSTFGYLNSFTYTTTRYYSVFSNLAYTYKGKYTLSGSYRTDAANFIAASDKSRYSPFWSVGGLWHMDREHFMASATMIDRLALRLTYGVNGNEDRSTSPYPLINTGSANAQTGAIEATISSYGNPLLRWEKTYTFNAGIDFSLWKGKLYGTVEIYQRNGKDILADVSIPSVNGVTTQKLNNVEMYNKGVDIELGSSLTITKNIHWSGNVNFSYNTSKITRLFRTAWTAGDLVSGESASFVEGYNASTLWSYRYAGIHDGQPSLYGPDKVPFFVGANVVGDARSWMENSGIAVAPYTLGMNHSFDIYRFTLSTVVVGKFGHVFRRSGFNYPRSFNDKRAINARVSEVINGDPEQILTLPAQNAVSTTFPTWTNQSPYLNYLVENAGHIRLQEVSLSYTVNPQWVRKMRLNSLRLYAQGNDLLTITNNTYNEDPEYLFGTINPTPRFTFGFKLQF